MTDSNLDDIRVMARKHGGKIGATIQALCDEVERLRKPQCPSGDLDAIRRMAESGAPIPPWLVLKLCDRVACAAANTTYAITALAKVDTERLALLDVVSAARAWADAIDHCDGIAAAEQTLREALRECKL